MGYEPCTNAIFSFLVVPCFPIHICLMRKEVRKQNRIDNDKCGNDVGIDGDCLAAACCSPCANCQIANELDHRGIGQTSGKTSKTLGRVKSVSHNSMP